MQTVFTYGATLPMRIEFDRADTGEPFDPEHVLATIGEPDGTQTGYEYGGSEAQDALLEKDSIGRYVIRRDGDQEGFWTLRAIGEQADETFPTERVYEVLSSALSGVVSTPQDVADLLRVRLRNGAGNLEQSFTDDTSPTEDQVWGLIRNEGGLILIRTGDLTTLPCPTKTDTIRAARQIIAKRVAAIVEASFRPEEVANGQDVASFYQGTSMEEDLKALVEAARE